MAAADITLVHGGVGAVADAVMLARATGRSSARTSAGLSATTCSSYVGRRRDPAARTRRSSHGDQLGHRRRQRATAAPLPRHGRQRQHPTAQLRQRTCTRERRSTQMSQAILELTAPDISCDKMQGQHRRRPRQPPWHRAGHLRRRHQARMHRLRPANAPARTSCAPSSPRSDTRPHPERLAGRDQQPGRD